MNLAGTALTLLSAEQVVGALIAKALVAPGAVTGLLQPNALSPAVQAFTSIDMFVVQALDPRVNQGCSASSQLF